MLIIAMNRVLIMHDNIHNHVIMNIIVNPTCHTIKVKIDKVLNIPNVCETYNCCCKTGGVLLRAKV